MQQVGVLKYSKVLFFMSKIFFYMPEVRWRVMFIFGFPLNLVDLRRVCVYVCVYVCVCWCVYVYVYVYVCVCWCKYV